MSDRTILQKYSREPEPANSNERAESCEDFGAFGWLRGMRERAVMLELRKKDGSVMAVGYGWLEKAEFDPSGVITLSVMGQKIRITGRNLNGEARPTVRLFEGLARHRVPWIQEASEPDSLEAGDRATVIDSLDW